MKNKIAILAAGVAMFSFSLPSFAADDKDEAQNYLEEKVDIGYAKVSRRALSGAVSTVTGEVLDKSPESNLAKTFAGRLSGLTVLENNGEPGRPASSSTANGVSLLIRGLSTTNGNKPLIIIDGQISPNMNYTYITPEEIETVTILKDAATLSLYGIQGGNGAIVITTKRGKAGTHNITVTIDEAMQQATHTPYFTSAADYARLRNQAAYNDGKGLFALFSQDEIDRYADGTYPGTDWYNKYTNKTMWMTRAGLNLSGGSNRVTYYANLNYLYESSPFKVEPNDKYNANPNINRFNFRSNIDVKVNDYLSAIIRLNGSINNVKNAGASNADVYTSLFKFAPTMFGPLTPLYDAEGNPLANGGQVIGTDNGGDPTYGLLNRSGYSNTIRADMAAQGGLMADLGMVTPGLGLSAIISYQTNAINKTNTLQTFETWVRTNDLEKLEFTKLGTADNTPLSYTKTRKMFYNLNLYANATYNRTFGDHSVDALAYFFYQNRETEETSGALILPYKRESVALTASYGFKNRYFISGIFAWSGSEQFHPDHRYMFTPSVGATWIASDESFMRWAKPALSLLKFRASYGIMGNDQLGDNRGLYWDNVDYNGNEYMRGNPLVSAEKYKRQNYGVDLMLFNSLNVSFDWFKNRCDNILTSSNGIIPIFQGIPLEYYPMVNGGIIENKGYEIAATYTKQINRDWSVFVGGSYAYNHNNIIDMLEGEREGYAYPYAKKGQSIGQKWGYVIDYSNGNGYFNFADEIAAAPKYSMGNPRLGDFIYKDLNNDGVIDGKDKAPIGFSNCPRGYYYFSAGFNWKGLEVSAMFQGTTKRSVILDGIGSYEKNVDGYFSDIHQNAWTLERWMNGEQIDYPALSLTTSTSHADNSYFIQDGSYLRLKNAEIAYNLPKKICKVITASNIRISLNGQNLITWDHLRSKAIDPEIGSLTAFQTYRVINLGVKLTF